MAETSGLFVCLFVIKGCSIWQCVETSVLPPQLFLSLQWQPVRRGARAAAGAGTGQSSCSGWPGRSSCREELVTSASEGSCEGEEL